MKVYACDDTIRCPKCHSLIDLDGDCWTVKEEFTNDETIYENCYICECGASVHWKVHYVYAYYDNVTVVN